uniref:Thymidine kinase n=1 Tax=Naja naja TaxID=35670 RepID=A0A8C7E2N8_NAJNA
MSYMMMPRVQPGSPQKARGQIQVHGSAIRFESLKRSTELMRRVRRFQIAQYKCLLIKYAKDTRYCVNGVSTHDRWSLGFRWVLSVLKRICRFWYLGIVTLK